VVLEASQSKHCREIVVVTGCGYICLVWLIYRTMNRNYGLVADREDRFY
jgi:hypothetical protein